MGRFRKGMYAALPAVLLLVTLANALGAVVNATSFSVTTSNAVVDITQYQTVTAILSGGSGPYIYNFSIYNPSGVLTFNALYKAVGSPSNAFTFQQTGATGAWTANTIVTDSVNSVISNTLTYTVDSALVAGPITPPAPSVDNGQSVLLTANPSGGTSSYAYQWYSIAGTTAPTPNPNNAISSSHSSTYLASPTSTNSYIYCVTDTATTPNVSCSSGTAITVNPILSGAVFYSSNATVDQNQIETLTYTISGGTASYTYNIMASNSADVHPIIANAISSSPSATAALTFRVPTSNNALGSVHVSGNVYDSASAPSNYLLTNTITVNKQLLSTGWTASNTPTIITNQSQTLTATISGGTSPFAYNFLVYDPNGNLVYNTLYKNVGSTTDSFTFRQAGPATGTWIADIIISDSASTPDIVTNSLAYTVNSPLEVGINPDNPKIDNDQSVLLVANVIGGAPPYSYAWYSMNTTNTVKLQQTGNTLNVSPAGTTVYFVNVTDSLSTLRHPFTTVTVNPTPYITLTPSNGVLFTGQSDSYSVTVNGGTGKFNIGIYNALNVPVGPNVLIFNSGGSNTVTFVPSYAPGTQFFYALATDQGTAKPFVFNSVTNTITVNSIVISNKSFNLTLNLSSLPINISFENTNTTIGLRAPFATVKTTLSIQNLTTNSSLPLPAPNDIKLEVINVGFSNKTPANAQVWLNLSTYNCINLPANSYLTVNDILYTGGAWRWVGNATYNARSCRSSYPQIVTTDPIIVIGLFEAPKSTTTTTTTTTASTSTTTSTSATTGTTAQPTTSITVTTTSTTTIGPAGNGNNNGVGGGGVHRPTVVKLRNNCYSATSIAQLNIFNVTINGQQQNVTENFISPTDAGVSINTNAYQLNPFVNVSVETPGNTFYNIELTNISIIPLQDTISLLLCDKQNTTIQNVRISIEPNSIPGSVLVENLTLGAVPILPTGYQSMGVFNISTNSANVVQLGVSAYYECTLDANAVQPFRVAGNSWNAIPVNSANASMCEISFGIPANSVIGLLYHISQTQFIPTNVTVNSTSSSTTSTVPSSTTVPTTTVVQKVKKNLTESGIAIDVSKLPLRLVIPSVIGVAAAIVVGILYNSRRRKPVRRRKTKQIRAGQRLRKRAR